VSHDTEVQKCLKRNGRPMTAYELIRALDIPPFAVYRALRQLDKWRIVDVAGTVEIRRGYYARQWILRKG
jgi:Fe2+ or Zn2+ uptake regulation protein